MEELVLGPLGMSRSHFQQPPLESGNTAYAYGPLRGMIFHESLAHLSVNKGSCWFMHSTPRDLAQMILAVQKAEAGESGGQISPAIAEALLKPPYDGWQGIGVRLGGEGKDRSFYHGGETLGYFARFVAGVSDGRGWIIMSINGEKDRFGPYYKINRQGVWLGSMKGSPSLSAFSIAYVPARGERSQSQRGSKGSVKGVKPLL